MKKMILCVGVLVSLSMAAGAQTKKKAAKRQTRTVSHSSAQVSKQASVNLNSTASYPAKAPAMNTAPSSLTISDPTIQALNARANGSGTRISSSGIVGMPKRAYGFANGHLTLYSTGATSSGTITGSGAVGTGTSLGSFGATGSRIGLNGKSPYAGSLMWGNAQRMTLPYGGDASVKVPRQTDKQ